MEDVNTAVPAALYEPMLHPLNVPAMVPKVLPPLVMVELTTSPFVLLVAPFANAEATCAAVVAALAVYVNPPKTTLSPATKFLKVTVAVSVADPLPALVTIVVVALSLIISFA